MRKHWISLLTVGAFLSGCSAIGPTSSPEFAALIQVPIPKTDGKTRFFGSANWFPNHRGFTDLRSSFLGGNLKPIPGALVIAEKAIFFEQWNGELKAYEIVKRLSMDDVMSATVDSFGRGRRLVVRKKDYSFDSFEFTQASGNFSDGEKTEASAKFMQIVLQEREAARISGSGQAS
jgi:hypothetical protein